VIKNIVSCGCSWMAGAGSAVPNQERLSALFAKRYNAGDINLAKEGTGNDRIVRKIVNWFVENKDKLDETLFLIGLSEPRRFEIWAEDKRGRGKYIRDITDIYNVKIGIDRTLREIFILTTLFEKYNCKYLIFDSMDNIKEITRRKDKYFDEVFNNKNYYSKESWRQFCSPRGKGLFAAEDKRMDPANIPDHRPDWGHPSAKGNQKWFEVLLDYIEENKLW